MFDWIRAMFQRRDEAHDGVAEAQEERQHAQFDEWDATMREVARVQAVARGMERKPTARSHHR